MPEVKAQSETNPPPKFTVGKYQNPNSTIFKNQETGVEEGNMDPIEVG